MQIFHKSYIQLYLIQKIIEFKDSYNETIFSIYIKLILKYIISQFKKIDSCIEKLIFL